MASLRPRAIWVERGGGWTWVANSLGGDVSFPFEVGAGGVHLAVDSGRGAFSTMRYEISMGRHEPDPAKLVEAVMDAGEAFRGGPPPPEPSAPVLLASRAAAAWLQWLVPVFTARGGPAGRLVEDLSGLEGFHIVDDPGARIERPGAIERLRRFDGEGRPVRRRVLLRDGRLAEPVVDSRDPEAAPDRLGPMRRDSYREAPWPGPMSLMVPADGTMSGRSPIERMTRGLHVTWLTPRAAPGSSDFLAEVRGFWVEKGRPVRPVGVTLMKLCGGGGLARLAGWGADSEPGAPGPPTLTPSLLFDGASFEPL